MTNNESYIKETAPVWPHPLKEGYVVTYKFTSGGIDYFTLADQFNAFYQRALSAMEIIDEWEQRITKDTARTFIQAMRNELDPEDGKIKISKISQYIAFMEERLNWPVPTSELFYKMASVAVFDQSEDPVFYDPRYNNDVKIPHWKKHGVDTFFLCTSIGNLMPIPNTAPMLIQAYTKIADKAHEMQMSYLQNPSSLDYSEQQRTPQSVDSE